MSKVFLYCTLICTTLLLFIGSILFVSSITSDFSIHDAPYDMVELSNLSEKELTYAFQDTVHYLYDSRELLDTHVNDNPLFNQKEIKHMKEVKTIFQILIQVFYTLLVLFGILILFFFQKRKNDTSPQIHKRSIKRYFFGVFIFFLLLGISLTLFFEPLFILFHQIVFQNDDWLLSLSSDHLIQFLPEQFFYKRAIQIALLFTFLHTISSYLYYRFYTPHKQIKKR